MSADISISDGLAEAMYANSPAWHRMGQVLEEAPNSAEAIKAAHLDWTVATRPAKFDYPQAIEEDGDTRYEDVPTEVPGSFVTYREDNGRPLGLVGKNYTIQQNVDCFNFLDGLLMDGIMKYESAMALNGGAKVAMLARMPSVDTIAEGDENLRYMLFSNSHDGKGSMVITPTSVRVVCANTLAIAIKSKHRMKVRHTGMKNVRLDEVRDAMLKYDAAFDEYSRKAQMLASRQVSEKQAKDFMEVILPSLEDDATDLRKRNREVKLQGFRESFNHPSNQLPSIKGTWWQLLNGVTYNIDHNKDYQLPKSVKGTAAVNLKKERKFLDIMEGEGSEAKQNAFNLAVEMAA